MYCDTNQFPTLPFFGPHTKTHGARGLSKHYCLRFDTKIFHGICEIRRIPCACAACKSILYKPLISGITSKKQARYQPVTNCTYWTFLGYYNNWNTIEITVNSKLLEAFYYIHQVIIDGISDNVASLVKSGMYGAIDTYDTTTNGFYVIQFISEAYTLQNNTQIDRQVIYASELVFKTQYLRSMQENTNWYWKQLSLQQTIIFPTCTILHPRLDVVIIRNVQDIPKNVCNMIQAKYIYKDILFL